MKARIFNLNWHWSNKLWACWRPKSFQQTYHSLETIKQIVKRCEFFFLNKTLKWIFLFSLGQTLVFTFLAILSHISVQAIYSGVSVNFDKRNKTTYFFPSLILWELCNFRAYSMTSQSLEFDKSICSIEWFCMHLEAFWCITKRRNIYIYICTGGSKSLLSISYHCFTYIRANII